MYGTESQNMKVFEAMRIQNYYESPHVEKNQKIEREILTPCLIVTG